VSFVHRHVRPACLARAPQTHTYRSSIQYTAHIRKIYPVLVQTTTVYQTSPKIAQGFRVCILMNCKWIKKILNKNMYNVTKLI
jgi:hypothetical protein